MYCIGWQKSKKKLTGANGVKYYFSELSKIIKKIFWSNTNTFKH